jgi:hypothetical protein
MEQSGNLCPTAACCACAAHVPVGGIRKPATNDIDFDAGVVDQMIERLTLLRDQMLLRPPAPAEWNGPGCRPNAAGHRVRGGALHRGCWPVRPVFSIVDFAGHAGV